MIYLSIIIPHYNTPGYLKKLIDTIPVSDVIQTIVIDDKSDVETEKYSDLKNDKRYSHVTFLDNTTSKKGAGVCRNIGLERAEGKWLLFADADDFFIEHFYDKVKKYFCSENEIVFFTPTSVILETNKKSVRHLTYSKILEDYLNVPSRANELQVRYTYYVPWSKLFNKDFIMKNDILFDETLISNDGMFSAKAGHFMTRFDISTDTIYCVTDHDYSLTKVQDEKYYYIRLDVFIRFHDFLKERLSKNDFRLLGLSGAAFLYLAFVYKLKFKKILKVVVKLKKNKVKIFTMKRGLNPLTTIKKIIIYNTEYNV